MRRPLFIVVLAACGIAIAYAQDEGTLNDQFEANLYYADRERELRRQHADRLTQIDAAYADAIKALSAENSDRLRAIMAANAQAFEALGSQNLDSAARSAEVTRIQSETATARAEQLAWYEAERKRIVDEHAANRQAQMNSVDTVVQQLREQRDATIARVLNAPVSVGTLRTLEFPAAADGSQSQSGSGIVDDTGSGTGPSPNIPGAGNNPASNGSNQVGNTQAGPGALTSSGGIDLGGTVEMETPADAILANANRERFLLHERLFRAEVERKRRAEEAAAREAEARRNGWGRGGGNDLVDTRRLDCNDSVASIYPGATEVCNYVDDDCDGTVDEGLQREMFIDRDGDRHGDGSWSEFLCPQSTTSQRDGGDGAYMSTYGNDCDDNDPDNWNHCEDGRQ